MCFYYVGRQGENEFYIGFLNNLNNTNPSIVITSYDSRLVSYIIEAPGIHFYHNGTVASDERVAVGISTRLLVSQSGVNINKGIYVKTSSDKVTVVGQNVGNQPTSDTFAVLPTLKSCSTKYVYYGLSVPRTVAFRSSHLSTILVVSTEENTTIKVTATQACSITISTTTTTLTTGTQYSFMINRLQTAYIGSLFDLTGTKIVTDKPVSVFSGHECGNIPWNIGYCDHIVEQIPPTTLWGKIYYTAPLATRRSYTIKILAAFDYTNINMYCNGTKESYTINAGNALNKSLNFQECCAIHATKKVLVVEFGHGGADDQSVGDPLMTLIPAVAHYSEKFSTSTIHKPGLSGYTHFVNIIVLAQYYQPDLIYFISGGVNKSLDTQEWVPVKVNNVIEAYATKLLIHEGVSVILHIKTNAKMAVIVYGFTSYEGYSHSGRLSLLQNIVGECNF